MGTESCRPGEFSSVLRSCRRGISERRSTVLDGAGAWLLRVHAQYGCAKAEALPAPFAGSTAPASVLWEPFQASFAQPIRPALRQPCFPTLAPRFHFATILPVVGNFSSDMREGAPHGPWVYAPAALPRPAGVRLCRSCVCCWKSDDGARRTLLRADKAIRARCSAKKPR